MRRIFDLVAVLLFVWFSMFVGLWGIDIIIVPFNMPIQGFLGAFITSTLKVLFAFLITFVWLWAWRGIVKKVFWHQITKG